MKVPPNKQVPWGRQEILSGKPERLLSYFKKLIRYLNESYEEQAQAINVNDDLRQADRSDISSLDSRVTSLEKYNGAEDSVERSTTSTSYTSEPNLSISITVKKDDVISVSLQGVFWNTSSGDNVIAHINLSSGSATSIVGGTFIMTEASSYKDYHGYTTNLYRAEADGTLTFNMKWEAQGGGAAYCRYRAMIVQVIGRA